MEFSIRGGRGGSGQADFRNFFPQKKMFFFHENYKVDQFSEDFNFSLLGGSGQKSRLLVRLFDFAILAKFGDYEHNRHKKNCGKQMFFS